MPNHGTNAAIGGGGFHHVAIKAFDYDATLKFYIEGLGFRRVHGWGIDERAAGGKDSRAALLDTGDGNYVEVFAGRVKPAAIDPECDGADDGVLHFAFRTADCAAALERARTAGATATIETKTLVPDHSDRPIALTVAFVKGLDGEVIEFFQCDEL